MSYRTPLRIAGALCSLLFVLHSSAQSLGGDAVRPRVRIRQRIDDRNTVTLHGNTHPQAHTRYDAGLAESDYPMEKMILVLDSDAGQQRALEALLDAQQDPSSPQYHRWLTPRQFGERFGASQEDIATVTRWLEAHGFRIEEVPEGSRSIIASATAAQVREAFHTDIHAYRVEGRLHHANASDPRIPAALSGVLHGIVSLHDFPRRPMLGSVRPAPAYTVGSTHYLAPADFAAIYNVAPLYAAGIDGTGQSVAVVGRTNIRMTDMTKFRTTFGLP
jgi:pseudomonalisin